MQSSSKMLRIATYFSIGLHTNVINNSKLGSQKNGGHFENTSCYWAEEYAA